MPLSAHVRTNTGEKLGLCGGPALNRLAEIARRDRGRFPLLYGVDPCSDTVFSRLQMEQLHDELIAIRATSSDPEVAAMADQVLALAEIVGAGVHRTIVFVGD